MILFLENAVSDLGDVERENFLSLSDCKTKEEFNCSSRGRDGNNNEYEDDKTILGIWRTNNFALGETSSPFTLRSQVS